MKISKSFITLCMIGVMGVFGLTAQNSTMTPYSRYGYGMLNDNATSAQRAMGGVGYAMNSGRQINVMNPASYANVDSLTFLFDMGIDFTSMWQKETVGGKNLSDKTSGGGLDYVTMQFRVCKYLGASIGILPYSSVGYAFGSEIEHGASSRQGSGSINQLYAGLGGSIYKGLTAGLNFAYLFGTTYNDSYAYTSSGSTSLFERQFEVRDWRMDIGLQYSGRINRTNSFTVGLTYSPRKDLHGHAITYAYDMTQETAPQETERTPLKGNFSIAESWGAGFAWHYDDRLIAEVDFTYQPWSKCKYLGVEQNSDNSRLADRYKIAAGLQFTPKPRGGYLQRIAYRVGGYFNRDYLRIMGNNLHEYGASVGFGFPVPSFKTVINLGLEWKHRQATPSPLIKENYLCLTLGINFNEMWFRKSRIY